MLVAIKIEYEDDSISVALYEGIEVEEFTNVIISSFHLSETIIGLKDPNGVIFLPKFICQNVSQIQQCTYQLLTKGRKTNSPIAPLKRVEPKIPQKQSPNEPPPQKRIDADLLDTLRYLKLDGFLNETEEKDLLEMYDNGNSDLFHSLKNFKTKGDFQTFKDSLKQLTSKKISYPDKTCLVGRHTCPCV